MNQSARTTFKHNGQMVSLDASTYSCILHDLFFEHGETIFSPVFNTMVEDALVAEGQKPRPDPAI